MNKIRTQRDIALACCMAAVAFAVIVGVGSLKRAEATGTRMSNLAIQLRHYDTSGGGHSLSSIVGTVTSTVTTDARVYCEVYVTTPSGSAELRRLTGDGFQDATNTSITVAQPLAFFSSGDTIRAVFYSYDALGTQTWTQQKTLIIP